MLEAPIDLSISDFSLSLGPMCLFENRVAIKIDF
jgi:hypothetical protein